MSSQAKAESKPVEVNIRAELEFELSVLSNKTFSERVARGKTVAQRQERQLRFKLRKQKAEILNSRRISQIEQELSNV